MESFHQVYGQRDSALFTSNHLLNKKSISKNWATSSASQRSVAQLPPQGSHTDVIRQSMMTSLKNEGQAPMNATAFVKNDNAAVKVNHRFAPPLMRMHHHQKADIGAYSQQTHLSSSSAGLSSTFSRVFNQSVFKAARPPMMPTIQHGRRRNTEIKMSSTLETPKVKKEEKTLIHSEAKLFTKKFTNGNAHVIRTQQPYIPDDPDKLYITSPSGDWNYVIAEEFNFEHSLFRFFRPGTVMNIDPYFQYIVQENHGGRHDFRNENVVMGGQLAQIVDNDLGKVLLQSDFRWVLENDQIPYSTILECGVYMSHKRNKKNGDVIRVVDFINHQRKYELCFDDDGDGDIIRYPTLLCDDFFFKPKNNKPELRNVDFFVEVPEYWSNYDDGMQSQYLDLKIQDQGVKYELNIPSGYKAQLIPVLGQIQIPNTKTRTGVNLKKDQIVQFSYDKLNDQKLQFQTISNDVHLTLLLGKEEPQWYGQKYWRFFKNIGETNRINTIDQETIMEI